MSWKRERDLLIAQTMAFVQSVTGKTPDVGVHLESGVRLEGSVPSETPAEPLTVARPADILPARLTPLRHGDLRDEIRQRIAAFQARQQTFHRDRDAYFNAMMAKARATSEQATNNRDNPPLKR